MDRFIHGHHSAPQGGRRGLSGCRRGVRGLHPLRQDELQHGGLPSRRGAVHHGREHHGGGVLPGRAQRERPRPRRDGTAGVGIQGAHCRRGRRGRCHVAGRRHRRGRPPGNGRPVHGGNLLPHERRGVGRRRIGWRRHVVRRRCAARCWHGALPGDCGRRDGRRGHPRFARDG